MGTRGLAEAPPTGRDFETQECSWKAGADDYQSHIRNNALGSDP